MPVSPTLPELDSVTTAEVWVAPACTLPKVSELTETLLLVRRPEPVRLTVLVPPPVTRVSTPSAGPIPEGLNTVLTVQEAPIAKELWQLCVLEKSPELEMLPTDKATLPVLFNVMDWA